MNPPRAVPCCFARSATSVLAMVLGLHPAGATEAPPAPSAHVLFMGADLSVQHGSQLYPVEDVAGSELKIHVGRQEVLVPTRQGTLNLQVKPGLKLAAVSVQLDQMQSGPAYTYGNDPMRQVEQAMRNAMDVAAAQDLVQTQHARDADYVAKAQIAYDNSSHPEEQAKNLADLNEGQARYQGSSQEMDSAGLATRSELTNVGAGAHKMALATGNFDAMEVSFSVSSPVELDAPYIVVLFRFHAPDAKPGVDGLVIHAQALDPIDEKPRYVRVLKGGLPLGFRMVDCAVHLYNGGREVATNLSGNRVEMTRRETQQYLVMEHIGAHKGADSAASAVRGTLTRFRRATLSQEQITRVFYVKVAPDGTPEGIFTNEACDLQIDDAGTLAAVEDIFFRPSLAKGKPVEGVARVCLADL